MISRILNILTEHVEFDGIPGFWEDQTGMSRRNEGAILRPGGERKEVAAGILGHWASYRKTDTEAYLSLGNSPSKSSILTSTGAPLSDVLARSPAEPRSDGWMVPSCREMGGRPRQEFVDPRTGTAYSKARTEMVGLDDSRRKTGLDDTFILENPSISATMK